MLHLTPAATRYLLDLRAQRGFGEGEGVHLERRDGHVRWTFLSGPEPGDWVVMGGGFDVYLKAELALDLDEAVIDARRRGERAVLVIRRRGTADARRARPLASEEATPASR